MDNSKSTQNPQDQNQKNKSLIIPSANIAGLEYLIILALSYSLNKKSTLEIAATSSSFNSYVSKDPLPENMKTISELPEQKVLLQFPGQGNSVKGIQWNQDNDQLNLYVSMEKGQFEASQMKMIKLAAEYKQIFTIAASSIEQLGDFAQEKYLYIFETAEVISIGANLSPELKNSSKIKSLQNYNDSNFSTLAENLLAYLNKNGGHIDTDVANYILAAIFLETQNFTTDIKNPKVYEVCATLVGKGASNAKAHEISAKFKTLQETKKNSENK